MDSINGKREEGKRTGSSQIAERKAKRAQLSIQILASLVNKNLPGRI